MAIQNKKSSIDEKSFVERESAKVQKSTFKAQQSLVGQIEQASRHLHALGHVEGLVPAQWSALRFFSIAHIPNNTAIALARHQGLAFGPVSRSVRTLISKGLLRKAGSAGPGRSEAVELTDKGKDLLRKDPMLLIEGVCNAFSEKEQACLSHVLNTITTAISKRARG